MLPSLGNFVRQPSAPPPPALNNPGNLEMPSLITSFAMKGSRHGKLGNGHIFGALLSPPFHLRTLDSWAHPLPLIHCVTHWLGEKALGFWVPIIALSLAVGLWENSLISQHLSFLA